MPSVESSRSEMFPPGGGAGSVRGKDQGLIAERRDLLKDGVVKNPGVLPCPRRVRQIRSSCRTDKERIPGKNPPAFFSGALRVDRIGHALGRVSGRFKRNEARGSGLEFLSVLQLDIRLTEQFMPARHDLGAGSFGQRSRAELEIFLAVRFENICDAQAVILCEFKIFLDIPARVDDHGYSLPATKHVGILSQTRRFHSFEKHAQLLLYSASPSSPAKTGHSASKFRPPSPGLQVLVAEKIPGRAFRVSALSHSNRGGKELSTEAQPGGLITRKYMQVHMRCV